MGRTRRRLALVAALGGLAAGAHAQESLALAIKASYLTKFGPFVQWPASVKSGSAFTLCVIGKDPFGALLDRAAAGQALDGRPVVVTRLASAKPNPPCMIAYLGGSRSQTVAQALQVLKGQPVLTVTDGARPPGVIDFVIAGGRVRFKVDDQAAAEDGLWISSKLLGLALEVTPRRLGQGPEDHAG